MNDTASCIHKHKVDDRVEVRFHINFLTSDTILDHCTLALEFDCSLMDPGQYFLVFRVGSVIFSCSIFTSCDAFHVAVV